MYVCSSLSASRVRSVLSQPLALSLSLYINSYISLSLSTHTHTNLYIHKYVWRAWVCVRRSLFRESLSCVALVSTCLCLQHPIWV